MTGPGRPTAPGRLLARRFPTRLEGEGTAGTGATRVAQVRKRRTGQDGCRRATYSSASGFRFSSSVPRVTPTRFAALRAFQTSRPGVRPASRSR